MAAIGVVCHDTRIVKGMRDHSKEIQPDFLFVVCKQEAQAYMQEALMVGGVVLCEQVITQENVYVCEDVDKCIPVLMQTLYGNLCDDLCVIGVSGTSGKTSVASILTQLLQMQMYRVMQIGTGFVDFLGHRMQTHTTTPGRFQLAACMSMAKHKKASHIVMEVSSHAIDQDRIHDVRFDMILYTNITKDHLDYHITQLHYRYTKFKLRCYLKQDGILIYNADEAYMEELTRMRDVPCISFGCNEAHFPIRDVVLSDHDLRFSIQGYFYHAPLLGMLNVYNVSEALVAMHCLQYSYGALQKMCARLCAIEGRLEILPVHHCTVWLDYAHTADALLQVLQFAVQVKKGRLITIIGCGGDRDGSKRSVMADAAAHYSDVAIFTSDNPRYEHVYDILKEMSKHHHENVRIFENRFFAIKHAVKIAQNSDIIIIAGKGNETSLRIRGREYPFSDRACIYELLKEEEH